jgi:hypothetical protein
MTQKNFNVTDYEEWHNILKQAKSNLKKMRLRKEIGELIWVLCEIKKDQLWEKRRKKIPFYQKWFIKVKQFMS